MKANLFSIALVILFLFFSTVNIARESDSTGTAEINCTPDLMPLVSEWVHAYNIANQNGPIVLRSIHTFNAVEESFNHLTFVTGNAFRPVSDGSVWSMVVARDIIVPVINSANPFIKTIGMQGISSGILGKALLSDVDCNWGTLLCNSQNEELHFYALENEKVRNSLGDFLKTASVQSLKVIWLNEPDLVAALQKDPLSIGICELSNILLDEKSAICPGLQFLPIDRNGNGRLDYMENIYMDVSTFLRGVWIGKYPRSLVSNVYLVSESKPESVAELAFIQFILSDEQKTDVKSGYTFISKEEKESILGNLLTDEPVITAGQQIIDFPVLMVLIICGFIVIAGAGVVVFALKRRNAQTEEKEVTIIHPGGFDDNGLDTPGGLLYDKSHMWAFMEKDGGVTVGIDDFIQHVTGPITRVIMKRPGDQVKKGEIILSILQSGKMLNLYAPVTGIVALNNERLLSNSSLINISPYNEGWVYKITPNDWSAEAKQLTNADRYRIWLKSEFLWLKDFLALALTNNNPELVHVVLQDGGTIREGALSDFGPVVWEDFQTRFLDVAK